MTKEETKKFDELQKKYGIGPDIIAQAAIEGFYCLDDGEPKRVCPEKALLYATDCALVPLDDDEFDERMAIETDGKRRLAEHIMGYAPDSVLDLGCGRCAVGAILRGMGYAGEIVAVDKRADAPDPKLGIAFAKRDVLEYMRNAPKQTERTAVVLSAVLHEIDPGELMELAGLINGAFPNHLLLIREPTWSRSALKSRLPAIPGSDARYAEYRGLNTDRGWTPDQMKANYLFARSYGEGAWEREKHEGRFTFDAKDIEAFATKCGDRAPTSLELERDPIYEKTLPYGAGKSINYTGTLFVCRRGE